MEPVSGQRAVAVMSAERAAFEALSKAESQVDRAMRRFIDKQPLGDFYDLVRYQFGWCGLGSIAPALERSQRTAGGLCLLVCKACGGRTQKAMPWAVCIGLLHEFGAMQQDFACQRTIRNGRPTLWILSGREQALNAADAVHALAKVALLEGRRRLPADLILRLAEEVDACWLRICEAAHSRMQCGQTPPLPEASEMELLCACASHGGCLLARRDGVACEQLREFGAMFGQLASTPAAGEQAAPSCYERALAALRLSGLTGQAAGGLAGLIASQLQTG